MRDYNSHRMNRARPIREISDPRSRPNGPSERSNSNPSSLERPIRDSYYHRMNRTSPFREISDPRSRPDGPSESSNSNQSSLELPIRDSYYHRMNRARPIREISDPRSRPNRPSDSSNRDTYYHRMKRAGLVRDSYDHESRPDRPKGDPDFHHLKPVRREESVCKWRLKKIAKNGKDFVYARENILKIRNIISFLTWDSAIDELQNVGVKWTSFLINQVLKTHPPLEKAWLFFNWASGLEGFKHDQFTYTTMLDIFGEAKRISSMMHLFREMAEKEITVDAVTCTTVMYRIAESGDIDGAEKIWKAMKKNCEPTNVSYTAYMKIMFSFGRDDEALGAYKEMIRLGMSPNNHTYTVLMEQLVESGKGKEALDIFYRMQAAGIWPDKAACNNLIKRLSKSGDTLTMSQILIYMKRSNIVLRYSIFCKALYAYEAAGESDILLRQANPHHSVKFSNEASSETAKDDNHLTVDEGLILILMKKENLLAADTLFAGIADKNIRLDPWIVSMIIELNCGQCRLGKALEVFDYSVKNGMTLSKSSYLVLLGTMIRLNLFTKVVEVVEEMIKAQHSIGIYLASILMHKLGKAVKSKNALEVFKLLPKDHRCSATYTALIGACFSVGNTDTGLGIFKAMQRKGIVPTLGTYNVVIGGLSNSGLVNEVREIRKEKRKKLQSDAGTSQTTTIPFEKKICDLLFIRDTIPI